MNDLISRQAALDALRDAQNYAVNSYHQGLIRAHKIITDLPPVKQKRGKWKTEWHDFFHVKLPVCSYCLEFSPFKYDYCPRCGAKMDEEKTDETN